MRYVPILLATAILLPAGPVQAGSKSREHAEKVICKTERFVGSNMSRRICKTREEWETGREVDKAWLDQNNGKLFNDPPKPDGTGGHIGAPQSPQ